MASMTRRAATALALAVLLAPAAWGQAGETRALILTIGDYIEPGAKLVGIQEDAQMALQIVQRLGARDIVQRADRQLTFRRLLQVLRELRERTRAGDTVIIYFSGHGRRFLAGESQTNLTCVEALVTVDNGFFFDNALQAELEALASTAARVVMFNDSCHSAGAATKELDLGAGTGGSPAQPKAWPAHLPGPDEAQIEASMKLASAEAQAACSQVSNTGVRSFSLNPGPRDKLVYLAASAVNEVAWATKSGSQATRAWHRCITQPRLSDDTNRDGLLSADELARCAQGWVRAEFPTRPQRITPLFNTQWPFVPVAAGGSR